MRIASLLAASTEILHTLGLWDQVVAVSHECDYPPEVHEKPRVTFTNVDSLASSEKIDEQVRNMVSQQQPLYRIDVDCLAALKPDLVITQAQCDVCAVKYDDVLYTVNSRPELQRAKVVALNPSSLDDVFTDILKVGEAAEVPAEAERLVTELRRRVEAIRAITHPLPMDDRPRTVCIEWIDPVMVAANWMPDLLALAGAAPGFTKSGERSTYSNWQDVIAFNPQIILIMPCGFDLKRASQDSPELARREGWSQLSAVRRNQVYAADGNAYFNRAGPRLVDSLEILAGLIHPDRFFALRQTYAHAWRRIAVWPRPQSQDLLDL